jgi:hypothetical protein
MICLAAVRSTGSDRSRETSKAPYQTIFKLHGYPESIVSNRDTCFINTLAFWAKVSQLQSVTLKMSTAFHLKQTVLQI